MPIHILRHISLNKKFKSHINSLQCHKYNDWPMCVLISNFEMHNCLQFFYLCVENYAFYVLYLYLYLQCEYMRKEMMRCSVENLFSKRESLSDANLVCMNFPKNQSALEILQLIVHIKSWGQKCDNCFNAPKMQLFRQSGIHMFALVHILRRNETWHCLAFLFNACCEKIAADMHSVDAATGWQIQHVVLGFCRIHCNSEKKWQKQKWANHENVMNFVTK